MQRGNVRKCHLLILVETDDPGGNPAENRLGEFTAPVDLHIRLHQLFAASHQLVEHAVEGQAKPRNLVQFETGRHPFRQIAAAHLLGNRNHRAQRFDDGCREIETDPKGGDQKKHQNQPEDKGEADLKVQLPDAKLLVVGGGEPRVVDGIQHRPVDEAADEQIGVDKAVQLHRGAKLVRLVATQDHDLAIAGLVDPAIADAGECDGKGESRLRHHLSCPVKDDRLGQVAQNGLVGQILI